MDGMERLFFGQRTAAIIALMQTSFATSDVRARAKEVFVHILIAAPTRTSFF
jgi:hypothetical protein